MIVVEIYWHRFQDVNVTGTPLPTLIRTVVLIRFDRKKKQLANLSDHAGAIPLKLEGSG